MTSPSQVPAHGRKPVVLITDRFAMEAFALLKAEQGLEIRQSASFEPTAAELADVEALIIRSRTKITRALLERAPRLRLIVTATSGFDHFDFEATQERALLVAHTPEANAQSAAELTWALVMACARRIPEAHRAVKNGDWSREALNGMELSGKTYGIIGLGRIGTRVAGFARAFGMSVLAYDPYRDEEYFRQHQTMRVGLDELIRSCDILSVHVPATAETRRLLHAGYWASAPSGLIVVNTSRGQAIDESALVEALQSGQVRAAGLDVYEKEPLNRASALIGLPNVVLSPHLGATTTEAFLKASREAAEKVIRFFKTGVLEDRLPPKATWQTQPFSRPRT